MHEDEENEHEEHEDEEDDIHDDAINFGNFGKKQQVPVELNAIKHSEEKRAELDNEFKKIMSMIEKKKEGLAEAQLMMSGEEIDDLKKLAEIAKLKGGMD